MRIILSREILHLTLAWIIVYLSLPLLLPGVLGDGLERPQVTEQTRHVFAEHSAPPKIDGRLESLWYAAEPADSFLQLEPVEGIISPFRTSVYILYDRHAMYLGFNCEDPNPDSISARIQRRDNSGRSDRVFINLDTFNDNRNGYYFGVTAAGVQLDGTISNENRYDGNWDGVWQSAVAVHDSGWTAEMRIPFSIMRHGGPRDDGWGANFTRYIDSRNAVDTWIPLNRFRGSRVSDYGTIYGFSDIASSMHVEFLPHVVGRWDANGYDTDENETDGPWHSVNDWENLGFDLKIVPSTAMTFDMTIFPDFAQVDVDNAVINLSDYPVYFPERRPFFLEGKQIFDNSPHQLLYTRRITDPDLGTRGTYQMNNLRASALVARNWDSNGNAQFTGAARGMVNVGNRSTVGLTTTYIEAEEFSSSVLGADTRLRWNEENDFTFAITGVNRTGSSAKPFATNTRLHAAHGKFRGTIEHGYRGRDANYNDLGWSSYTDQHWNWGSIDYREFPENGYLESYSLSLNGYQESLGDGRFPYGSGNWNFGLRLRNYWNFWGGMSWGTYWRRLYADEDAGETGEFTDNFGEYDFTKYNTYSRWFGFQSDIRRPLEAWVGMSESTHRNGKRWAVNIAFTLKPTSNFISTLSHNWQQVRNVSDVNNRMRTNYHVVAFTSRWSPSLELMLRGTVQYITAEELDEEISETEMQLNEHLVMNLLLSWNWRPNSWLYIIYDDRQDDELLDNDHPGDRTVRLKWTYFLSLPA